mmetsp:Transcript_42807/g.126818  ORF Transcript_42807/g.126818 Transcript_42807/m.126818 type:complete len:276 (-) Transcript_42807:67-894(-)
MMKATAQGVDEGADLGDLGPGLLPQPRGHCLELRARGRCCGLGLALRLRGESLKLRRRGDGRGVGLPLHVLPQCLDAGRHAGNGRAHLLVQRTAELLQLLLGGRGGGVGLQLQGGAQRHHLLLSQGVEVLQLLLGDRVAGVRLALQGAGDLSKLLLHRVELLDRGDSLRVGLEPHLGLDVADLVLEGADLVLECRHRPEVDLATGNGLREGCELLLRGRRSRVGLLADGLAERGADATELLQARPDGLQAALQLADALGAARRDEDALGSHFVGR